MPEFEANSADATAYPSFFAFSTASSIAPTLAALLRIAAPSGATGRVLSEALYSADAFTGTAVGPPAPR